MQATHATSEEQEFFRSLLVQQDIKHISFGSGKPVYEPPCSCTECQDHFYLKDEQAQHSEYCYTRNLNDIEAKSFLSGDVEEIKTSHTYIKRAVEVHGDTIVKAWRKISPAKRAAILREVEPSIAERKGLMVDLTVAGLDSKSDWSKYRKNLLVPFVDIETLTKNPAAFFGLIHARAHCLPQDWAFYDSEQLRSAWGIGALKVAYHGGAVVMYGENYGTITAWDKERAHRCDIIGYPRASLIIEAQAVLLKFLRLSIGRLLEGNACIEGEGNTRWSEVIRFGLKMNNEIVSWSKFVHEPFTGAPRLDIDDILSKATLRLDALSDHLWLLQTEPSYLKRHLRKLSDTSIVKELKASANQFRALAFELFADLEMSFYWRAILVEFENLRSVYKVHEGDVRPGVPLPQAIDDALGALEVYLVNVVIHVGREIETSFVSRPGFSHLYDMTLDPNKETAKFRTKKEKLGPHSYQKQKMLWLLNQLVVKPDSATRFRYPMILDLLEDHLASSDRQERGRLDDLLYAKLSDYLVLLEMLFAVRMHRPKTAIRTLEGCRRTEDRLAWNVPTSFLLAIVDNPAAQRAIKTFMSTEIPSGGKNYKWLQVFESAHTASQSLWRAIAAHHEARLKKNNLSANEVRDCMLVLQAWNSEGYRNALETKRTQVMTSLGEVASSKPEDTFLPLVSSETLDLQSLNIEPKKAKLKTRGEPNAPPETLIVEQTGTSAMTKTTIIVPKKSHAMFRYMFPEFEEERQKQVPWDTFVVGMGEAGFSAKNGGGSIVAFEDQSGNGKINFHRPHPDPVIDPIMLRTMGRRLNKWFGWTRETFVLATK